MSAQSKGLLGPRRKSKACRVRIAETLRWESSPVKQGRLCRSMLQFLADGSHCFLVKFLPKRAQPEIVLVVHLFAKRPASPGYQQPCYIHVNIRGFSFVCNLC